MKTYIINKNKYNLSQDLIVEYPDIFKCYTNGRVFVTKNNISKKIMFLLNS